MSLSAGLTSRDEYTVGWLTVLSIERAAATAMLDEQHEKPLDFKQSSKDTNSYTWGCVGKYNVVIASLAAGVMGTTNATTTALAMLSSFPSIKFALLVGIGAGVPNTWHDVRLGDVVVSQPCGNNGGVVQYDLGRAGAAGKWERRDFLARPPEMLLKALANLQSDHGLESYEVVDFLQDAGLRSSKFKIAYAYPGLQNDRLFEATYQHVENRTNNYEKCDSSKEVKMKPRASTEPEIHYDVIASGNTLINNVVIRDNKIDEMAEQIIFFEMVAAGLMNEFPCLVIRAAFAKEFLLYVDVADVQEVEKAYEALTAIETSVGQINDTVSQARQARYEEEVAKLLRSLHVCDYAEGKNRNKERVKGLSAISFMKDDFADQQGSASAICALLCQLYIQKPELLSQSVTCKFKWDGRHFVRSFSALWSIFTSITSDQRAGEVLRILDASDECQIGDRELLIEKINRLFGAPGQRPRFKFLLTSRPYDDIRRGIRELEDRMPTIHLSGENETKVVKISQEIDIWIQHRLQKMGIQKSLLS
ncbi:MAG: hypothetical protein Q9160_006972 [Pyrenula sp. 1 TL-2023]